MPSPTAHRPRRPRRLNVEPLEDRTCPTITISGPTTLHAGDRVQIEALLTTTTDPDENGEGELLQVSANGGVIITDSSYNTTSSFTHLAVEDETITAAVVGEDGDEDGTVTISPLTGQTPRFSDQEKREFNEFADAWNLESSRDWRTSIAVGFAGVATGAAAAISAAPTFGVGAAFFTGATVDLGAVAALYAAKATYDSDKAVAYGKLARDPFDPNFTTVAQPVVHQLYFLTQQPTVAPFVPAFQAALGNDAMEVALLEALNTAANRANSARQSGDPASEALQVQAIATFERQLVTTVAAEPTLLLAAQAAARSLAGTADLTATPSDIHSFESGLQQNGLPQISQQVLGLAGNSAADIQAITNTLFVQDSAAAAGDPIGRLTDPTVLGLIQRVTGSLGQPPLAHILSVGGTSDGQALRFTPFGTGYVPASPVAAATGAFPGFAGDVRAATGDFDADGVEDTVMVTGPGTKTAMAIVSGKDDSILLQPTDPFGDANFTFGGFVAAGDIDGDGRAEWVVTPELRGGPRVVVFHLLADGTFDITSESQPSLVANFFGIGDPAFRDGDRAALGDVNGDGILDVFSIAAFNGGPRTALYDGRDVLVARAASRDPVKLVGDFFAAPSGADEGRGGRSIAVGDVNGDKVADLIATGDNLLGTGNRVVVFSGADLIAGRVPGFGAAPLADFTVGGQSPAALVSVAAVNADGDANADLAVGSGAGEPSLVKIYRGRDVSGTAEPASTPLDPFGAVTLDGVFVG